MIRIHEVVLVLYFNLEHKFMTMHKAALLTLSLFIMSVKLNAQTCPDIIGYYPNWQWYDRAKLVTPMTIQYSKYSIINYAFFKPELSGAISSTDSWADENLLLGQINWSTSPVSYYPNTSIVDRAHNANTKILPSIGGWTLSDNFPSIAASSTKRITFAHSCCDLIRTYNFDGIDIDWEYPGFVDHGGTPTDKQNFTLFLQTIKDSLTALGVQQNKSYILTACFGASKANMQNIEWNSVKNLLNSINLMSYDYFGSWDAVTNHNAPLYKPQQGDATFNLDSSVTYLMNNYGVPANKISAGVAFYGRSAKTSGAPALFAPLTGADNITFSDDDGTPMFYNILKKQNLFTRFWDVNAQVPYLVGNGNLQSFVSYDDQESIGLKANYIKNKNLKGAIIWEITGDYLETVPGSGIIGSTPLIDTLKSVLCNGLGGGNSTTCAIPNSINATAVTSTSATLNWTASNASSYNMAYKKQTDTAWIIGTSNTNSTNLTNLACNTPYEIKVQAICTSTNSSYSSIYSFTTAACGSNPVDCNAPLTFNFDPATYIPLGEIKIGQGRCYPVWGTSVDAYIPANKKTWAMAMAHAANLFKNVTQVDNIPANFYFATAFKESFCGCDSTISSMPVGSPFPFSFQASSLGDGCFQIESISAYNEMVNMYPNRYTAGNHPNVIGNGNFELAAIGKAYYDIFTIKYWETHKGWNPTGFFNAAVDPNAAIRLMAVAYNRGLWYPSLDSVLNINRTAAMYATSLSPYFNNNAYGYDYQNALTQYTRLLNNETSYLTPAQLANNPSTSQPYNYFNSFYDPSVSWSDVNTYIDIIAPLYPTVNFMSLKSSVQATFNNINSGNAISFRYQFGEVLDKIMLLLPADNPSQKIAQNYGCFTGNVTPSVSVTPSGTINLCSGNTQTLTATPGFSAYSWSNGATSQSITVSTSGNYQVTATTSNNSTVISNAVTINVTNCNTNLPPTVSITSPTNNSIQNINSNTMVTVLASDADGTITAVELYRNNVLLGTVTTAPYTFSIANANTGTFTLVAKAYDNSNASTNSTNVVYTVNASTSSNACNYPSWNAGSVYNTNDTVLFNNNIYKAKYWTQNDNPSTSYGNCCVWDYIMPCGGFTASTCFKPTYDPLIAYAANQEVYLNGNIYRAKWWTLNENPSTNSSSGAVWLLLTTPCMAQVNLKSFLQGYYLSANTMQATLFNQGISNMTNLTDSLRIELHSALSPFALIHTYIGYLNTNGDIVCSFPSEIIGHNYYIVVKHRNTLETWSQAPVTFNAVTNYNYTTAASQAYGSNQTEVEPGVFALYSGDINQDGFIDSFDFPALDSDIFDGVSGVYVNTDLNGDGFVDSFDFPWLDVNSFNGVSVMTP